MNILGFNISRTKAAPPSAAALPVNPNRGSAWYRINESFPGAWQQNVVVDLPQVVSNPVVFSCITRIASDMSQMPAGLEALSKGIWTDTANSAFSPVLRKPNHYQNHIQFKETWALSKLYRGNTYVLKERDNRNVVVAEYVLAPDRVTPLVADDGSVFYRLKCDNMAGGELTEDITVPDSEIIHDRYNCLYHPLIGLSPLFAAGIEAMKQLAVQNSSTQFFNNRSQPGGILTAPGAISDDTAARLKEAWTTNFTGENAGKIAVVGDGLKYEALAMTAQESQMIEQLQWGSTAICAAFQMPPFMVGFGPLPQNSSVEAITSLYYSLCLKQYVVAFEACQTEGLGLGADMRVSLDENSLLRMDKSALYKSISDGIRGGFLTPNEGRKMDNRTPIKGGDTVYLQEQDHSLQALAARDQGPDPFGKGSTPPPAPPPTPPQEPAKNFSTLKVEAEFSGEFIETKEAA